MGFREVAGLKPRFSVEVDNGVLGANVVPLSN